MIGLPLQQRMTTQQSIGAGPCQLGNAVVTGAASGSTYVSYVIGFSPRASKDHPLGDRTRFVPAPRTKDRHKAGRPRHLNRVAPTDVMAGHTQPDHTAQERTCPVGPQGTTTVRLVPTFMM